MVKGVPLSPGIGLGRALLMAEQPLPIRTTRIKNRALEKVRFNQALAAAIAQIKELHGTAAQMIGREQAGVLESHLFMLQDRELLQQVHHGIDSESVSAECALQAALDFYLERFATMENAYLRERALDIRDVGNRLLRILTGTTPFAVPEQDGPFILAAKSLAASDLLQVGARIAGFITESGGETSHTAILARSLAIPALSNVRFADLQLTPEDFLIIDGTSGDLLRNPSAPLIAEYRHRQDALQQQKADLLQFKDSRAITADGTKIRLYANINDPADLAGLSQTQIDGIGLFRTEFLFMNQTALPVEATLPTEAEQFRVYREVLEKLAGKPVSFRTLDIGGDKSLPVLTGTPEANPFLGYRGLRVCLDRRDIFATQLRAILRASLYGNSKIMFPMVGSLEEFRTARGILEAVKENLRAAAIPFRADIPVGILVEIPATAVLSDLFAREADFLSIGTNDLIQYTLAVDRLNAQVADLYQPLHPAILRLIKLISDNARRAGKPVGICGEMAGDTRLFPVLLGLGLTEFSISPASLLAAKEKIRSLNSRELQDTASQLLELGTAEEVRRFLKIQ